MSLNSPNPYPKNPSNSNSPGKMTFSQKTTLSPYKEEQSQSSFDNLEEIDALKANAKRKIVFGEKTVELYEKRVKAGKIDQLVTNHLEEVRENILDERQADIDENGNLRIKSVKKVPVNVQKVKKNEIGSGLLQSHA